MRRALALLALAACGDDAPVYGDPRTIDLTFPSAPNRDLDLLIVMDDTIGLPEVAADLSTHLPEFLERLSVLDGTLPNLHIGMATSDMGTTGSDAPGVPGPAIGQIGNGGCSGAGKDGTLVAVTAGGPIYISDVLQGGVRAKNYSGELATALGDSLRWAGGGGCGFEQHLRATRRALTKPENSGFLRKEASLAVVIVADEDDCSLRSSGLLAADTSVLGPLQSYRCTQQGVVCDESLDTSGTKTHCRPREDSSFVEGVAATTDFLDGVKPPHQLVVAGIVGDRTPFVVSPHSPPGGGEATLGLDSVCSGALSGGVHPSPRLHAVIDHFSGNGTAPSICATSTRSQLLEVARTIQPLLGVICLDTSRLTITSTPQGLQPACQLTEIVGDVETRLTDYEITADATACPDTADHLRLIVRGASTAPGAYIRARCETPY
jgi:hypothetical protein